MDILSHLLATARQITDYDSAQRVCERLANKYRQLELLRLQEENPDKP